MSKPMARDKRAAEAAQIQGEWIKQGCAEMGGDAALGSEGRQPQAGQDHQRPQVAAAKPHECTKAAGADEGHAHAEHQSADNRAGKRQRFGQVEGLLDRDETRGTEQLRGDERGEGGQGPGP